MTDALSPETGALNRLSASEQMVVVVVAAVGPFLPGNQTACLAASRRRDKGVCRHAAPSQTTEA